MARGKVVTKVLLDSSQAAMFAGIEIHNKPNISYRYQTSTILVINAWELALKAFIYKYIGKKQIYENDKKHTIPFTKAVVLVRDFINRKDKSFVATAENLFKLNDYRCTNVHFSDSILDPIIFMLIGKAVLNYHDFLIKYFNKDITDSDNLIILPIGFKLPFDPVDYLKQDTNEVKNEFVNSIIDTIRNLKENSIEDSIVIGFNLYTESVKKITNADIIAAIDQLNGTVKLSKACRITDDPNAPSVRMIPNLPPLRYTELREKIKEKQPSIKFDKKFNAIMKDVKKQTKYCKVNYLDPNKKTGTKAEFYEISTVDYVIAQYTSDGITE